MRAKDLMTTEVVTVRPDTKVPDIAKTLLERRISAVPVVDGSGRVVGLVSEGDLMHRAEAGGPRHRSWWIAMLTTPEETAFDYINPHSPSKSLILLSGSQYFRYKSWC